MVEEKKRVYNYIHLPNKEVARLYQEENLSCVQIAKMFGVGHKKILSVLNEEGVERKPTGYFVKGKKATDETRKLLSEIKKGKPVPWLQTEESRRNLSEALKKTHSEKKYGWFNAKNNMQKLGGTDAEVYFEKLLIKNKISNYKREFIVKTGTRTRYTLDFAFIDIMLGIELDGDSHKRRKEHDHKKDLCVSSYGWEIVRIPNIELFANPNKIIRELKSRLSIINQ